MNVRHPSASPLSSASTKAGGLRTTDARTSATTDAESAADSAGTDRLELSAQGRAEAAGARQGRAESPEVETARVALRAGGGLTPERLHELRERVRTGYYDEPEAMDRLAEAATDALTGQTGTA